jgi:hypothetical protein
MIAELPAERLTLLDPATPPKAWTQIAGALLVATDVYHTVSRKPGFDLASEVRASIANARNHGLLKLEKLEWNSGSPGTGLLHASQNCHFGGNLLLSKSPVRAATCDGVGGDVGRCGGIDSPAQSSGNSTPRLLLPPTWDDLYGAEAQHSIDPLPSTPRVLQASEWSEEFVKCDQNDERGNCEPECSDLAPGRHHPSCSSFMLEPALPPGGSPSATFADELRHIAGSAQA